MAGKFYLKSFSDINLSDPFFDSLKADYPGSATSTGFIDCISRFVILHSYGDVFDAVSVFALNICVFVSSVAQLEICILRLYGGRNPFGREFCRS